MEVPVAPPTAFMMNAPGPVLSSDALEMSTQKLPQTVVAFFVTCVVAFLVTCGPGDALAAPAAATQRPLVKRLRMVVPSCGLLGRPPSRWHGRSSSAGRGLVRCWLLLSVIPPCQPVVVTLPWVDIRLLVALSPTAGHLRDWPDLHELDVPPVNAVDAIWQIQRINFETPEMAHLNV